MDDELLKERALHIRDLASKADPVIKKRLLDLAALYDRRMKRPPSSLPSKSVSDRER
jgi:hypothetical protein